MKTSRKPDESDRARGKEIARLRRAAGLTQEGLASLVGLSHRQIGNYERGKTPMSVKTYEAILSVLRPLSNTGEGFSESQASYEVPSDTSASLLKTMRKLRDGMTHCIEVVERMEQKGEWG